MRVGVKYCGNCNPHLRMSMVLQAVTERMPSVQPVGWEEAACETLLILCGCPTGCAKPPAFDGPTVFVTSHTVNHAPVAGPELVGKIMSALRELTP